MWGLLRTTLAMNSRMPRRPSQQHWRLLTQRTEIRVEEALALLGADDVDQGDGKEVYSPDPDVRLIRNVWARIGVMERVRGAKYMWGLFACNELLHRRFGMLESDSCSCCPNTIESPWHVIGGCNDDVAVQARSEWGDRMWEARGGRAFGKRPRSRVGVKPFALMSLMQ
jgi:hypothetical protein